MRNPPERYHFWGSHGSIACDPTGKVVARESCDCDECGGEGYSDVVRVDLAEWRQWAATTPYPDARESDILNVTLHYRDGGVVPFEPDHRNQPFYVPPET
jgi:hypothetical protein